MEVARPPFRAPDPEESAFLASYDPSPYARPSVAVDVVLLTIHNGSLMVHLVRRDEHPAKGRWALPGGFVRIDEPLDDAATRVLATKASVTGVFTEQLYTFGAPDRDPRTRVISVAYFALVPHAELRGASNEDARLAKVRVEWPGEEGGAVRVIDDGNNELPLAFDHPLIIGTAVKRLRGRVGYSPIGYELLPTTFTLRDLLEVHEVILGRRLNKDSFRRRMLDSGQLRATGEMETNVGHRPAELYEFVGVASLPGATPAASGSDNA